MHYCMAFYGTLILFYIIIIYFGLALISFTRITSLLFIYYYSFSLSITYLVLGQTLRFWVNSVNKH